VSRREVLAAMLLRTVDHADVAVAMAEDGAARVLDVAGPLSPGRF
jgi:hypothetical protein